jgi:hypothetical protein
VLIKSVAQAIPTYVMGVFKLPATTCNELTQLIRRFWWGEEDGQRKVHWVAWEKMLLPKIKGGMGFRDMRLFNKALLARQAWRLIQFLESLCARLLKAKYYPNGKLVDSVFSGDASPTWKAIEHGLELLKEGIIWRVGSGSKIQIWSDRWLNRAPSRKPMLKRGRGRIRWVSQLMTPDRKEWDVPLLCSVFHRCDAEEVLNIRLSERVHEDFIAWFYEKSSMFSVKSAYHLAVQVESRKQEQEQVGSSVRADGSRPLFNEVWSAKVPAKVKIFAWRLSREGLATQDNRKRRTLERVGTCQVCGMEDETGYHATVTCTKAVALRHEMRQHWTLPEEARFKYTGPDWLLHLLRMVDEDKKARTLLLLWRVWHHRNDMVHGKGQVTIACSAAFLRNYAVSLEIVNQEKQGSPSGKGKEKIEEGHVMLAKPRRRGELPDGGQKSWTPPPAGWAKLNVDAGFVEETGRASAGVVIRDMNGGILLSVRNFPPLHAKATITDVQYDFDPLGQADLCSILDALLLRSIPRCRQFFALVL